MQNIWFTDANGSKMDVKFVDVKIFYFILQFTHFKTNSTQLINITLK